MLVLISGLPATGKSTVARMIAREINARVLRTDEIRKAIIKKPEYSEREKDIVYSAMLLIADELLKNNINVVLDATFYKKELRERAKKIAKRNKKKFLIVETVCNEKVVKERMRKRKKNLKSVSDADFDVYKKIKKEFEEIEEEHVVVDTYYLSKREIRKMLREELKKALHMIGQG